MLPAAAQADQSFYRDAYPSSYFLTNIGQVTPVKLQAPWEDCWAFAVASAIESSILKAEARGADAGADSGAGAHADADDAGAATSRDTGKVTAASAVQDSPMTATTEGTSNADTSDPYVIVAADGADAEAAAAPPQLSNLANDIDISERALAWFAHEPQTDVSGGSQAGEGYHLLDAGNNLRLGSALFLLQQNGQAAQGDVFLIAAVND